MNIVVCIKQVPNTDEIRLDPKTGTLIREGVTSVINPDDKAGLEAALRLKDAMGAQVTALSLGPPQAEDALREALAMGVDEAVLVTDRAFAGGDTLATAYVIAAALRIMDYDLIITGHQAIGGDTAQVGPQISEFLNIPNISYAEDIGIEGNSVIVTSRFEVRRYVFKAKMPCLVTVLSELNVPRYMTPGGIFDAYRKEIKRVTRKNLDVDDGCLGLKGSPTRVIKTFSKNVKSTGTVLNPSDPQEAARCMLKKLREKFIL